MLIIIDAWLVCTPFLPLLTEPTLFNIFSHLIYIFHSTFTFQSKGGEALVLCDFYRNFAGMNHDIDHNTDEVNVCVFAASSSRIDEQYVHAAYELGRLIAVNGWTCVNGAGSQGLMRAVSDGALDAGGNAIGVIPKFMVDNNWHYDRLTSMIITPDMHERKQTLADMAQAVVALPGGCGTLEELLEMLTWRQLHLVSFPIIVLNTGGFYDPLIEMVTRCIDRGFMKPSHHNLWHIASTPQQVIEYIQHALSNGVEPAESKY